MDDLETSHDVIVAIERFLIVCEDTIALEQLLGQATPGSMRIIAKCEAARRCAMKVGAIWSDTCPI